MRKTKCKRCSGLKPKRQAKRRSRCAPPRPIILYACTSFGRDIGSPAKKHDAAGACQPPAAVQGTRIAVARRSQSSSTAHTPRARSAMHCCDSLLLQGIKLQRRRRRVVAATTTRYDRAQVGDASLQHAPQAPRAKRPLRACKAHDAFLSLPWWRPGLGGTRCTLSVVGDAN